MSVIRLALKILLTVLTIGMATETVSSTVMAQTRDFSTTAGGSAHFDMVGRGDLTVGYARVQAAPGSVLPAGMAIIANRSTGTLSPELSLPLAPLLSAGRTHVEISGINRSINTAIAIANPNSHPVTINFYFTDLDGRNFREGSTTVGANSQLSAFLHESPFETTASNVEGTFTFTASALVSAAAVRVVNGGIAGPMMSALTIVDLSRPGNGPQTLAHFAAGGGWMTELILVNPTDAEITGSIQPLSASGETISPQAAGFGLGTWSIPARTSTRWRLGEPNRFNPFPPLQTGSLRIIPTGGSAASVTAVFNSNIGTWPSRNTETSVSVLPAATAFRMFVEQATALAIANTTASTATVNLQLLGLDGVSTSFTGMLSIPPNGQSAVFLTQIGGFASLPPSFQGLLRISSSHPVTVLSLRTRHNEQGILLISTNWPIPDPFPRPSSEFLFPQIAIGGDYQTELILFGERASIGTIYFFDKDGNPLDWE